MHSSARQSTLVAGVLGALIVLAGTPAVRAGSGQAPETFAQLVAGMRLVIVARVSGSAGLGYTYTIERVLKGSVGPVLRLPPDAQAAVEPGWTEVVIAFSDPSTDDFRAPTIAWHVGTDSTIDPEGYQRYPGLPATLDAMLAAFGLTSSSAGPASPPPNGASPAGSGTPSPVPALALGLLLATSAVALWVRMLRR